MNLEQLRSSGPLKDTTYDDPTRLQLAHISTEEANLFDQLQGYTDEDPKTGFRKYEGLLPVFANPQVREVFENATRHSKGAKPKEFDKLSHLAEGIGQDYERTSGDYNPAGEELISHGQGGDDELAFFPLPILDYFDSIMGKPSVNEDGLPQYSGIGERFGKWAAENPGKSYTDYLMLPGVLSFEKFSNNPFVNFRNDVLKPIAKNPIAGALAQIGTAVATGGLSLPAQLAAQAGTAGLLSRTAGNKYSDVFKDAAIAGIVHGAGHMASGAGYGQGARAITKGVTHYGATAGLGRNPNLLASALTGLGDYAISGFQPGSGASGLVDTVSNNIGGLFGYGGAGSGAVGGAGSGSAAGLSPAAMSMNPGLQVSATGGGGSLANLGSLGATSSLTAGVTPVAEVAPSIFEQLTSPGNLMLAGLSAASLFKGHKDEGKLARKAKEEHARESQEKMNYINKIGHEQAGIDSQLRTQMEDPDLVPNPEQPSTDAIMTGRSHRWLIPRSEAEAIIAKRGYKSGGKVKTVKEESFLSLKPGVATLVHGAGKGQDDAIVTDYLHDGDYVIDSSTVSGLGDGSSDAGGRELDRLMQSIDRSKKHINAVSSNKQVPAKLSDKEYVIPSKIVTKLGDGDHNRGSNLLKDLVKQIRRHKKKNGDRLPPKSKNVEYYIRKAGGRI